MTTVLLWLFGALVALVGGVFVNLLSTVFEGWGCRLARRLVRTQARKMGDRAERCEEEWLAHLEDMPGALAKLDFAVSLQFAGVQTLIERWRDGDGEDLRAVAVWLADRASVLPLLALVLLFFVYPFDGYRYASFAVLVPLLLIIGLSLAPRFREAVARTYDRLSYPGRVALSGLVVPLLAYFVVAMDYIPPQGLTLETAVRAADGAIPPVRSRVRLYWTPPVEGGGTMAATHARVRLTDPETTHGDHFTESHPTLSVPESTASQWAELLNNMALSHPVQPDLDRISHSRWPVANNFALQAGFEALDLSQLPPMPRPRQPISVQEITSPLAPPRPIRNLRIISQP